MTTDELKSKIAELEAASAELRQKIQANTDAARKLNDENRTLITQRREAEHVKNRLEHELRKAEKEAAKESE